MAGFEVTVVRTLMQNFTLEMKTIEVFQNLEHLDLTVSQTVPIKEYPTG